MDEISTGGGFTGGGGGENYNPGADFMNLLGIGSTKRKCDYQRCRILTR